MSSKMTEAGLHKLVAEYLAVALQPPTIWTTFPAGGGGKARGGQLKARGLRPGWPDVQVLHPMYRTGVFQEGACFVGIELKSARGTSSVDQSRCHIDIRKAGGYVFICRSLGDVERVLDGVGIPLRARLMAGGGWDIVNTTTAVTTLRARPMAGGWAKVAT